jgi:hypothetical protein
VTARHPHAYTAIVVSSPGDILQLDTIARQLTTDGDELLTPRFFLASLSVNWVPRVVVVRRGHVVVGIVYGKERRLGGFLTGIVFADGRLGRLGVAAADDREDVIAVAIETLFATSGVRAVRLAIPPGGVEARAIARVQHLGLFDLRYTAASPFDTHARLPLTGDYQTFLACLGSKTRHNFRYYRRKFDAAGHKYVHDLTLPDLDRAATVLRTKSRIPSRRGAIERAVTLLSAAERPWASGLKHRNGAWLSVAAGWCVGSESILFLQMNNDLDYGPASLSVVLRAHLIERLIQDGTEHVVFWSGAAPPLSRYAPPVPTMMVCLDRSTTGWRMVRSLIGRTQPLMPRSIAADVRWMTSGGLPRRSVESLLRRHESADRSA